MIELGEFNTLEIIKSTPQGLYLSDEKKIEEILLPGRYVTDEMKVGNHIKVFLYNDSEDRPIATTLNPLVTLNNFSVLTIKSISKYGAFADWGLPKDLLIPFGEQLKKLKEGDQAVVMLYLDKFSNRLAGTCNIRPHLNVYDVALKEGDEVDILIFDISELGAQVIVNKEYLGMIYHSEIFQPVKVGDQLKALVKKIREDKRLDISLQKSGYEHVDQMAKKIMDYLESNKGFLELTDKSDPKDIEKLFQISKKTFKKAIGALYKEKKILIKDNGVYLAG